MPLFDLQCPNCSHAVPDKFFHVRPEPNAMPVCEICGHRLAILITSMGVPLTRTYAEDRAYVDHHIRPDGKPQVITSYAQRERLKREFGVEDAGARRGEPGCWA